MFNDLNFTTNMCKAYNHEKNWMESRSIHLQIEKAQEKKFCQICCQLWQIPQLVVAEVKSVQELEMSKTALQTADLVVLRKFRCHIDCHVGTTAPDIPECMYVTWKNKIEKLQQDGCTNSTEDVFMISVIITCVECETRLQKA